MQRSHTSNPLNEVGNYLLKKWKHYHKITTQTNRETLEVFQVFGFIARIYERIRASVENKGEQVIRRFAIERALKRPDSLSQPTEVRAERLIRELTWSRFLPNNYVTREQYSELITIVDKYQRLTLLIKQSGGHTSLVSEFLFSLASAEIEELLVPSLARTCLVPTFTLWAKKTFKFQSDSEIHQEELDLQIYLAAHRAIAKSDAPLLQYYVLLLMFPTWTHADDRLIEHLAANFNQIHSHLNNLITHPWRNKIYRWVRQNTATFLFLETMLTNHPDPAPLLRDPEAFQSHVTSIAAEKYRQTRKTIHRGIVQSILYIFFTKVLVAFLIEYPYERYITQEINAVAIGINLVFPPLLMLLMGLTVKAPGDKNTQVVVRKLDHMLYNQDSQPPTIVRFDFSGGNRAYIFNAIYAYFFIIICLLVAYTLRTFFHFNIVSLGLFFMFLSMIMLFGFRLRWQSEELLINRPPQGFLANVFSLLTMPFINLGVWLSSTISKVNVITFLLDKIIDAPLKASVNSAEEWSKFISDRRTEAVEIPRD